MGLLSRLGKATGAAAQAGGLLLYKAGERKDIKETAAAVKTEQRAWDTWKLLRAEGITTTSAAITRKDKGTEKILDIYGKNLDNLYDQLNPKGFMEQQRLTDIDKALIREKIDKITLAQESLMARYMYETSLPGEKKEIDKRDRERIKKEQEKIDAILKAKTKDDLAMIKVEDADEVSGDTEVESDEFGVIDALVKYIQDPYSVMPYEGTPIGGVMSQFTPSEKQYNENQAARFKKYYGETEWNALRTVIGNNADPKIENISDAEAAKLLNKQISDEFHERFGPGAAVEKIKYFAKIALEFFKGKIEEAKAKPRDSEGRLIPKEDLSSIGAADADAARYMSEAAGTQDIMKEGGLLGGGEGVISQASDLPPKYVEGEEIVGDPSVTWSPTDPAELMRQSYAGTQTGYPPAPDAMPERTTVGKTTITLSDDIPEEATEKAARKERLMGKIKAIIISSEPNQGFQEAWTSISGRRDDPNLTSMKVKDIIKKYGHKAFGAGQFTYKDFMIPQVKKHLGKSKTWLDDQTFDILFQNMLFTLGIEDAGINEFLNGTKTSAQFQKSLNNIWRALPKTTSAMKGDISDEYGNVVQTPGTEVGAELMSTWTSQ